MVEVDVCLLCRQLKKESSTIIKITKSQWMKEGMEKLLEKHFWPMKTITELSWICSNCWHTVKEFDKFYMQIVEAHSCIESTVKVEEASLDFETFTNDTEAIEAQTNENADNSTIIIKSETSFDEAQISLTTELPRKTRNQYKDPLKKSSASKLSEKNAEDHKQEQQHFEDVENVLCTKSSPAENYVTDPFASHTDDDDMCSYASDTETIEDVPNLFPNWKSNRNVYYKPRTNRNEHDEFLAKHFQITCDICKTPMATFQALCKHFNRAHNKQGFVTCCKRKFLRRSVLVDHIHCHLDPEYFKCKRCGKLMSDRRCLESHMKNHDKPRKTHICDICGNGFSGENLLRNHKLTHLSEAEKKFPCEQCGKPFATVHLLSSHIRVVHLDKYAFVCDICGSKMRTKEVFDRHISKHQGLELPTFSCDICGAKMTNKRGLKHHKKNQHPEDGKKEHACHLCGKISPTLDAHKRHVKYKHELSHNFKCTMCDKAFKRPCSLKEHMAKHTGTVLYTCPHCPKTFNSNANMYSHRKKIHPTEWEEAKSSKYSKSNNSHSS
ncbi:transcription factor grauzone [Stomoxys calcitrans]|uniref:transcription factor grauzone n=1 Tax=Stomoxys calcitrans TaxID=35570 RepID=UPI0027E3817B|nr:transcription factor grauzone [Stomoxys calcitrans]